MSYAQIRINEFLIDPTQKIELLNLGTNLFDISGWFLDDTGGSTYFTVPQNTALAPNSCTVFESDFNLNKTSADSVRLFSSVALPTSTQSALIDSFSYKASSGSSISFKRLPDGATVWGTGAADLGFYNNTTLSCVATPSPTVTPPSTPTPTTTPTPVTQTYDNIYISEIMVNPGEGPEWVELYNDNVFDLDLADWYLDDQQDAGSSLKKFSMPLKSKSYGVYELSSSMFNNDGDSVRLLDPVEVEKDSTSFATSQKGKSLGKIILTVPDLCVQDPSKGRENNPCISTLPEPTATPAISLTHTLLTKPAQFHTDPYITLPPTVFEIEDTTTNAAKVLGMNTSGTYQRNFSRPLTIISLSYSLLTIAAVFFRMKTGL